MRLWPTDLLSVIADVLTIVVTVAAIARYVLARVGAQRIASWLRTIAILGAFPAMLAITIRALFLGSGLDLVNALLFADLVLVTGFMVFASIRVAR
jgi:hypothetical protein